MHVLLIEPDKILSKIYAQALERAGYSVAATSSAQTAIYAADMQRPDIVILEMQLAQHSGAAFLYEFRTYSDWVRTPIIIHTMLPPSKLQQYEQCLRELNVDTWLYKPRTSLARLLAEVEAKVVATAS